MEFRQLKYFIEVAEREHVSEAAAHLHVAQSAISRQIANLENELGVQLFEREGRNVKLLPIGKIFLVHAKEAMKAINYAKKQMDEYIDPERGSIKIGFPTSLASTLLPSVLSQFKATYPNIHFQLRQGAYNFLIDAVKERELDIAFIGPVLTEDPNINGDILFQEKLHLLTPNNHRLSKRKSVYLTELKDEDFVLFPKGYIFEKLVVDACNSVGFDPHVTTEGEDLDAIKGLVAAGIGVTVLPESAIGELQSSYTAKIPISSPDLKRSVGMITPKHRELAPSEKVFYQFVIDYFTNYPGQE
ncbi:LysR family transcriptional activator of glutamate synthase operon [Natronobacillus azotifigens]|uniref:LysR family transcriptional regulator n=1 Tax=Natronobacillus azotifigens TaxID=472978 RepID=A0A9J6R8N0_9BACI|nr:LysR family transcriptional regulator [Natronobacillus azotifigens]MCZ0701992.1 LysR family transcriptional regulator [Natronobacillus azotifigens]